MSTSEPAARIGPTDAPTPTAPPSRAERLSLWGSSLALLVVCLLQAPGRILPETKLDVVVNPGPFLGRSVAAWDPLAGFGRLQNQAAGYLFPMGPVFWLGHLLGLPPWLTQRLWIAGLLIAGLWGARRLARALGLAGPGPVVAGLTYTLAPATVATIAFQSAGQLPYALAPWMLVPLVGAHRLGSPRRAAALSGLAVLAMGGVNGAATIAVLPLAVTWFLTRPAGPERRRLAGWWGASVVLATAWWVAALLVYVRYGARFTSYTETAAVTTSTESATEVLRGTGNWIGYLFSSGYRWLPGAWGLVSSRTAIVGSTLVAAGGMFGLARRDAPARRWLVPTAVLGAAAVGMGHAGTLGGGFGPQIRTLLDGPLVPFRNVHKFSPLVRLPLAVGLGHLVSVAHQRWAARTTGPESRPRVRAALPATAAVALVVLAILPALPGRLAAPGSFSAVPGYWRQAIGWLDDHATQGRALLVPGASFGEYAWGRPLDEPLSALGHQPWATRDLVPLGGDGSTRVLDALDRSFGTGVLPPGFLTALRRAGVRHLVVRNDLDRARAGGPSPVQVHRLLAQAPELTRVAAFGPPSRTDPFDLGTMTVRLGPGRPRHWPAVEVFQVPDPAPVATLYPVKGALVTAGAAEAVVQLAGGAPAGRAIVLDADVPPGVALPGAVAVTTDTARRRDLAFGTIRDNASYTLTARETDPDTGVAPVDRIGFAPGDHLTVATESGARVTASAYTGGQDRQPQHQPYAAFDGDPATAWIPGVDPRGQWVELTLPSARAVTEVGVRVPVEQADRITELTATSDTGRGTGTVSADGFARILLPAGRTRRLRITVSAISGLSVGDRGLGISEVTLPGLTVRRPLATPADRPPTLSAAAPEAGWLVRLAAAPLDLDRGDEDGRLERLVRLSTAGERSVSGSANVSPGAALDALLAASAPPEARRGAGPLVDASSTWHDVPAFAAAAALDGDPSTAWVSGTQDDTPSLTILWPSVRSLHRLTLVAAGSPLERVTSVEMATPLGAHQMTVPASGELTFPAVRTDRITLTFPGRTGRPVGMSEVVTPGLGFEPAARRPAGRVVTVGCGRGPSLTIDGRRVPTRASTTAGDLEALRPVPWEACGPVPLAAGTHRIDAGPDAPLRITTLAYGPRAGLPGPGRARSTRVERWAAEDRRVAIGPGAASLLATTENANPGWEATLAGHRLLAVRIDGWRQGWLVPAGPGGTVALRYRPGPVQRLGLLIGLLLALVLVTLAAIGRRGSARIETEGRDLPAWALLCCAVVAGWFLGGPLVLFVVPLRLLPGRARVAPRLAGAATVLAGAIALWQPGRVPGSGAGTFSAGAQAFAVLGLLALAVSALPDGWTLRWARAGSTRSNPRRGGRRPAR